VVSILLEGNGDITIFVQSIRVGDILVNGFQIVLHRLHRRAVANFEVDKILEVPAGILLVEIHAIGKQEGVGQHDVVPVHEVAHMGLAGANFQHYAQHLLGGN